MPRKKWNTDSFILASKQRFGADAFDYSQAQYVNATKPVTLRCIKHDLVIHPFPSNHLRALTGCTSCKVDMRRTWDTKRFVSASKERFGTEAFDYSVVECTSNHKPVTLRCIKHDLVFDTQPSNHLQSVTGCRLCGAENNMMSTSQFVSRAKDVHGNKYSYNRTLYVYNHGRGHGPDVQIYCNTCKEYFWQRSFIHLSGSGCGCCANKIRGQQGKRMTEDEFVAKASQLFPSNEYPIGHYIDYLTPVKVVCTKHQTQFWQKPRDVIHGNNACPHCQNKSYSQAALKWLAFVEKRDGIKIQHALEGGEKMLQGVGKVDGWCEDSKKVFEFHGDFFHGNPTVYGMTDFNPVSKELMGVLWLKTMDKEFRVEKAGYEYEAMWEKDWKKMIRAVKVIGNAWKEHKAGRRFKKRFRY